MAGAWKKWLVAHGMMCDFLAMNIELKEDVVSLTDFARNTRQHAEELAQGGRARILTQNGKAAAVVLSLEAFEKMAREAEEYRMDLRLRKAMESYAAGNPGTPAKKVISRIRKHAQQRRAQA
jgi:PHD/YefM family antitoxin component YafN of YafNO toxin-antitoxin module